MREVAIVVPCYNESERLDGAAFRAYLEADDRTTFVLVNDGSTDDTLECLRQLRELAPDRISIIDLVENAGKAEAVRQGMLAAMEMGVRYAGYWDADLATPLGAISAFCEVLDQRADVNVVLGARVRLLGRTIERRPARHYLGRVFATAASLVLDLPVYDTQCGAKIFRVNRQATAAFFEPFRSRWIFDVELIARLTRDTAQMDAASGASSGIYELPLLEWRDMPGSKLRTRDFIGAAIDLVGIYAARRSRRDRATDHVGAPVGRPPLGTYEVSPPTRRKSRPLSMH